MSDNHRYIHKTDIQTLSCDRLTRPANTCLSSTSILHRGLRHSRKCKQKTVFYSNRCDTLTLKLHWTEGLGVIDMVLLIFCINPSQSQTITIKLQIHFTSSEKCLTFPVVVRVIFLLLPAPEKPWCHWVSMITFTLQVQYQPGVLFG